MFSASVPKNFKKLYKGFPFYLEGGGGKLQVYFLKGGFLKTCYAMNTSPNKMMIQEVREEKCVCFFKKKFQNKSVNRVYVKWSSMERESVHRSVMPFQYENKIKSENTTRKSNIESKNMRYTSSCLLELSSLQQGL